MKSKNRKETIITVDIYYGDGIFVRNWTCNNNNQNKRKRNEQSISHKHTLGCDSLKANVKPIILRKIIVRKYTCSKICMNLLNWMRPKKYTVNIIAWYAVIKYGTKFERTTIAVQQKQQHDPKEASINWMLLDLNAIGVSGDWFKSTDMPCEKVF